MQTSLIHCIVRNRFGQYYIWCNTVLYLIQRDIRTVNIDPMAFSLARHAKNYHGDVKKYLPELGTIATMLFVVPMGAKSFTRLCLALVLRILMTKIVSNTKRGSKMMLVRMGTITWLGSARKR